MNRLNEELLRVPNMDVDDDDVSELVTAVNPDYADAVNEHEKIKDKLEDDFKEQEKEKEAFIKDTERREIKFSAPKQIKKMKLSESLFEDCEEDSEEETLDEAIDFGNPNEMGRGVCTPLIPNHTRAITDAVKALDDDRVRNLAIKQLSMYVSSLSESREDFEGFNRYWTERYPAGLKFIEEQIALIPEDVLNQISDVKNEALLDVNMPISANVTANGNTVPFLNGTSTTESLKDDDVDESLLGTALAAGAGAVIGNALGEEHEEDKMDEGVLGTALAVGAGALVGNALSEDGEELEEATAVATDTYIYKKKRMPLADILMAELCEGEYPVYRKSADGKLRPTNGPHFNLDYDDVAASYDDKGDCIIAWVATEELANRVATLGDKYDREVVVGSDKYVSDTPYFVKIYVRDEDWETPYVDPDSQVR